MFDRRNPARRAIASGVVVGGAGGLVLAALELMLLRLLDAPSVALAGGLSLFTLSVAGPLFAVGLLVGLVQGGAWWAVQTAVDRAGPTRAARPGALAAYATLLFTPIALWLALRGFEGRRALLLPLRPLWIAAATTALAACFWGGLRLVFWVERATGNGAHRVPADERRPRWSLVGLVVGLLGLAFLALGLDRRVLVRLYPFAHATLEVGAFVLVELAVLAAGRALHASYRRITALARPEAAVACLLAGACLGALGLARARAPERQVVRAVLYETSPLGTRVLDAARALGVGPPPSEVIASAVPASSAGPALPAGVRAPGHDVVLITVDALRADHLGAWGYARATSPRMDALAREGVRFARAYAPVPHTSFSLASVLLGKHAYPLDQLGLLANENARHETLADVVRRYGYRTAGFFPPAVFYVDGEHFKGFEAARYGFEYVRFEPFHEDEDARARTDQVLRYLEVERPERALIWVHYFGPHEPYVPHPELGDDARFGTRGMDLYDGEIRWVDGEIGRLVDGVRATRPGAIIVISADHGEEFGEHGGAYHGTTLFDEQLRVPLIVVGPGVGPRTVERAVSTVDIVPTILGLLDIVPSARVTGTDLTPWLATAGAAEELLPPVAAASGGHKMIVLAHEKLLCDIARDYCRLYDLEEDPRELVDASARRPERVRALRALLETWLATVGRAETGAEDPLGRHRGAVERAALGDHASWPEAVQVVVDRTIAVDARRRAAAILARGMAGLEPGMNVDASVLAVLQGARDGGDAGVDEWTRVALAALGDADARAELATAPTTTFGALALARGDEAGAVVPLLAALAAATEVDEKRLLIGALGRSRDVRAVPALIERYQEVRSRRFAAAALGELRRAEARSFLIARLADEPYTTVRAVVALSLGRVGGRGAAEALRTSLETDPDAQVAGAAAHGLSLLGLGRALTPGTELSVPSGAKAAWVILRDAGPVELEIVARGEAAPTTQALSLLPGSLSSAVALQVAGARGLTARTPGLRVVFR